MNQIPSYMKPVNIPYDPTPDHSFIIYPYQNSLSQKQAIQGHLVEHGIADYWLKPNKPHVLSGIVDDKEQMRDIWKKILQTGCQRLSEFIDLPEIRPQYRMKKRWEDRKNLENNGHYLCFNCISNGRDRFMKCWDALETYRVEFLKRLKKWIVDSIQDNNMKNFYLTGILPQKGHPARRHIHTITRYYELKSYVIENRKDGRKDVFCIAFKSTNEERYHIGTCYGIGIADSEERAKRRIYDKVRASETYEQIVSRCHPLNWEQADKRNNVSLIPL